MVEKADQIFRDFVTDGVPASGKHKPKKSEIRAWGRWIEDNIEAGYTNGGLIYDTKSNLDSDLAHDANASAWVVADGANNGIYRKIGASGTGSWTKIAELPYSVVYAQNAGTGTADAVEATSSVPISTSPHAQLISVPFTATNTAAMTLSINGETPRPLVTNVGAAIPAGYVQAGMAALVQIDGNGNYRLFSYGDASAIQAAAEAAQLAAEDAAERAESAAAGVESPVSYEPQTLTPTQQEQARTNIGIVGPAPRATARIRREWLDSTRSYDVIEVRGPNAALAINQVVNPEPGQPGVQRRIPLREFARIHNVPIAANSMAFRNADGSPGWNNELLVPNGLCIAQGQLVADWASGTNTSRTEAVVMHSDGRLRPAYRDSSTGAGLVAAGARFAVGWGKFCIIDGETVPDYENSFMANEISARNVLGQRANGDIVLVLFEGATNIYGVWLEEIAPVMHSLGCEIAFICEGGGSVQAWWNSYYAHGSSDQNGFRTMPSAFIIDAVTENEYDSGWVDLPDPTWSTGPAQSGPQLQLRQVGPTVNLKMNVGGFSNAGQLATIPARYLPRVSGEVRHLSNGGGGFPFMVYMQGGNTGVLTVERMKGLVEGTSDPTAVNGMMSWFQRL